MKRTISGAARKAARRRTPHRIGPAVLELVHALQTDDGTVEIRLSATTARAIARIETARGTSPQCHGEHPAAAAVGRAVTVDRATAMRWRDQAWQAVGEGQLPPADAQALSDQLEPRGAA